MQEWRPEGNPPELELSFHQIGPDGTQVIKFGQGYLYLQSSQAAWDGAVWLPS